MGLSTKCISIYLKSNKYELTNAALLLDIKAVNDQHLKDRASTQVG